LSPSFVLDQLPHSTLLERQALVSDHCHVSNTELIGVVEDCFLDVLWIDGWIDARMPLWMDDLFQALKIDGKGSPTTGSPVLDLGAQRKRFEAIRQELGWPFIACDLELIECYL
jgi:hypothetical protein